MSILKIRQNFNQDVGREVFTIERKDGGVFFPDGDVVGYNYDTREKAEDSLKSVEMAMISAWAAHNEVIE